MKGDELTLRTVNGKKVHPRIFKFVSADLTKSPKSLDLVRIEGMDKQEIAVVFSLDGDKLRIAWNSQSNERPKALATKKGDNVRIYTLQRHKTQ